MESAKKRECYKSNNVPYMPVGCKFALTHGIIYYYVLTDIRPCIVVSKAPLLCEHSLRAKTSQHLPLVKGALFSSVKHRDRIQK